jgi:hypothetical protein
MPAPAPPARTDINKAMRRGVFRGIAPLIGPTMFRLERRRGEVLHLSADTCGGAGKTDAGALLGGSVEGYFHTRT